MGEHIVAGHEYVQDMKIALKAHLWFLGGMIVLFPRYLYKALSVNKSYISQYFENSPNIKVYRYLELFFITLLVSVKQSSHSFQCILQTDIFCTWMSGPGLLSLISGKCDTVRLNHILYFFKCIFVNFYEVRFYEHDSALQDFFYQWKLPMLFLY